MGKHIGKALRRLGWGEALVCLQEVPKWIDGSVLGKFVVHTSRSREDRASNRDGFDCGFLVLASLNPLIRDVCHRPYWSGLLLPGVLVFSVHFLHHLSDDGSTTRIDTIRGETQAFYIARRMKNPPDVFQ